jgi:hypothetical protein
MVIGSKGAKPVYSEYHPPVLMTGADFPEQGKAIVRQKGRQIPIGREALGKS